MDKREIMTRLIAGAMPDLVKRTTDKDSLLEYFSTWADKIMGATIPGTAIQSTPEGRTKHGGPK